MPTAYAFRVTAGDGVHLVAGSVVEVEGGDPAGRAFYGVVAVP